MKNSIYKLPLLAISAKNTGVNETAGAAGLPMGENLPGLIGDIVGSVLGVLGTVFLLIIVIGGIMWMTSGGNEDQVRKSKSTITAAAIGLIVVFLSYALARFIGTMVAR